MQGLGGKDRRIAVLKQNAFRHLTVSELQYKQPANLASVALPLDPGYKLAEGPPITYRVPAVCAYLANQKPSEGNVCICVPESRPVTLLWAFVV